jgi:hypothetical protein
VLILNGVFKNKLANNECLIRITLNGFIANKKLRGHIQVRIPVAFISQNLKPKPRYLIITVVSLVYGIDFK